MYVYVYLGGRDSGNYYADILEYSDSDGEERWSNVGEMSKVRYYHAVSIIDFDKFKDYCQ